MRSRTWVWASLLLALLLVAGQVVGHSRGLVTTETITVAGTAVGLTSTTYDPAGFPQMNRCSGRLETAEIRVRWDGTSPTSSVGTPLEPLEILTLRDHDDIARLKMIRTTSTSGSITFTCWRE